MSDRGVLVFAYDGSFEGLMSAVFDAFSMKTLPDDIFPFDDIEPTLLKIHTVETNFEHAKRVEHAIAEKLGRGAENLVRRGFLYDGEGKETAIMRFLWKGFNEGAKAASASPIGRPHPMERYSPPPTAAISPASSPEKTASPSGTRAAMPEAPII